MQYEAPYYIEEEALFGPVTLRRQPLARHGVPHRGHIAHPGGVDPLVVEVEESADSDRVVKRAVRPSRGAHLVHVFLGQANRVFVHLPDERVERAIPFRDRRGLQVSQNALNEIPVSQQLRRDRGV